MRAQRFNDSTVSPLLREATRRRCNLPPDALVLGFIGRIVRSKGIIELAGAWKELRHEFPALHLLLVGPHETQDPIPAEIDRMLHSDPRVHFLGEQENMPPLYAVMDVLALPTYREGFPNVLLEAAGMKVPVVATQRPRLYRCGPGRCHRHTGSTIRRCALGRGNQDVSSRWGTSPPSWGGGTRLGASGVPPGGNLAGLVSRAMWMSGREGVRCTEPR